MQYMSIVNGKVIDSVIHACITESFHLHVSCDYRLKQKSYCCYSNFVRKKIKAC